MIYIYIQEVNYKNKLCVKRIFYIGKFYTIFILSFYSIIININIISNITYFVKLIILFVNRKFNISHNYYVVNISIFRAIKLKKDRKKDRSISTIVLKPSLLFLSSFYLYNIIFVRFFSFSKEKWLFQDFHWLRVSWQTITLAQEDK